MISKLKKSIRKSHIIIVLLIACLSFTFFYLYKESNIESLDISNALESGKIDKGLRYTDYLGQTVEESFVKEDDIETADAIVSYDEALEQYSIELSLKTNGDISEERIETFKGILNKNFEEVKLTIN